VTIATLSLRRVSMFSFPDAATSSLPMSTSYGADCAGGEVSSRKHDTSLSWTSGDYQSEVLGHSGKRRGGTKSAKGSDFGLTRGECAPRAASASGPTAIQDQARSPQPWFLSKPGPWWCSPSGGAVVSVTALRPAVVQPREGSFS
jgi:hypothetical protein